MKRNLLMLVSSLTLLLYATSSLFGADRNPPQNMTFQGFLTDNNGIPYGNDEPINKTIKFTIYAHPTEEENPIWGETQVVTIDKGHFNVLLGLGSEEVPRPPLSEVFTGVNADGVITGPNASSRWIELEVDSKVISPRIQFFAAPYAQLARVANQLASETGPIKSKGTIETSGTIKAGTVESTGAIIGTSLDLGSGNITSGDITSGDITGEDITANDQITADGITANDQITADKIKGNYLEANSLRINPSGYLSKARITNQGSVFATQYLFDSSSKAIEKASAGYLDIGGITLQWGNHKSTSDESQSFPFSTPFSGTPYSISITRKDTGVEFTLAVKSMNATHFTIDRDNAIDGDNDFYWMAIGPQASK